MTLGAALGRFAAGDRDAVEVLEANLYLLANEPGVGTVQFFAARIDDRGSAGAVPDFTQLRAVLTLFF